MEYREVYTRDELPTGRIVEKSEPTASGDYFLHALLVLKSDASPAPGTGEGLYILQQRSLDKKYFAGLWDVTGGGVRAGETPREGAVREVREELGLEIDPASLTEYDHYRVDWDDGTGLFISMFACRVPVPDHFNFDPVEVNDVRVVPFSEYYEKVMTHNGDRFGQILKKIESEL